MGTLHGIKMNPIPQNNPTPINLPPIIISPSIDYWDDWDWNSSEEDDDTIENEE